MALRDVLCVSSLDVLAECRFGPWKQPISPHISTAALPLCVFYVISHTPLAEPPQSQRISLSLASRAAPLRLPSGLRRAAVCCQFLPRRFHDSLLVVNRDLCSIYPGQSSGASTAKTRIRLVVLASIRPLQQ